MKRMLLIHLFLLSVVLTLPYAASADQRPEMIIEKMAVKFSRGVVNAYPLTSVIEIPKQVILTGRDMGPVGYIFIGPLKGIGMTAYRIFIGVAETALFLVPQPGYYNAMIEPAYVWEGWETKKSSAITLEEEKNSAQ